MIELNNKMKICSLYGFLLSCFRGSGEANKNQILRITGIFVILKHLSTDLGYTSWGLQASSVLSRAGANRRIWSDESSTIGNATAALGWGERSIEQDLLQPAQISTFSVSKDFFSLERFKTVLMSTTFPHHHRLRAKKFNSVTKWLGMVGGTLALMVSTFMVYNKQSKQVPNSEGADENSGKVDNGRQRLDDIKYLSKRVSEVAHGKESAKYWFDMKISQ